MFRLSCVFVVSTVCFDVADVQAETLHKRVDALIVKQAGNKPLATDASDSEFTRRIYLDVAGRIPTTDEVRAVLTDKSPDKREKLIDALLASPDYARRMHELFHVMLMERRGNDDEWSKFLRKSFETNLPWDELARAILRPDADNEDLRGAAYFVTGRLVKEGAMAPVDIPGLTRDVGRLIAGVDLQCAQCHNHLTVSTYLQKDFQGLHMIYENVQQRRDVKFPALNEKVMIAKKEFKSVFDQEPKQTGPVIPGKGEVEIQVFAKGEEFAVPPDTKKRVPGVPKFSPLDELAKSLANRENRLFCRNIVNRMWFIMMGRGLVEPLDLLHAENEPTHPELLDLLANELAAHDFDMRWLFRELALTQAYQRSSQRAPAAAGSIARHEYMVANEKRLSAEQLFWSIGIATGEFAAERKRLLEAAGAVKKPADKKPADEIQKIKDASLEELVKLSENLGSFQHAVIVAFGNDAKDPEIDFTPTVKGALFMMHEAKVQDLLVRKPGNLIDRLASIKDRNQQIDELFLSIVSRAPGDDERNAINEYVASKTDRVDAAWANVAWALMTSTEFTINH